MINFIVLDSNEYPDLPTKQAEELGLKLFSFEEVVAAGEKEVKQWAKVTPDSIYAFSYTSGTTGDPKGALISHRNICSVVCNISSRVYLKPTDRYISYLPMPHVLERAAFNGMLYHQVQIGVYSGNV